MAVADPIDALVLGPAAVDGDLGEPALLSLQRDDPLGRLDRPLYACAGTACAASISPLLSAATIASPLLKKRNTTSSTSGRPPQ